MENYAPLSPYSEVMSAVQRTLEEAREHYMEAEVMASALVTLANKDGLTIDDIEDALEEALNEWIK